MLPAGPTVADIMANAAFYYGLVRALADDERPVWTPDVVRRGRGEPARGAPGTASTPGSTGPALGEVPVDRAGAAPAAAAGRTRGWTAGASTRPCADRLLGIIEQRCLTGRNGAAWQAATVHRLYDAAALDRHEALRRMTLRVHRAHAHQRARAHLAVV